MPEITTGAVTVIAKMKTNKAFVSSKHIFNSHVCIIWSSPRKIVSICQSTCYYYASGNIWQVIAIYSRDQTYIIFHSVYRAVDWRLRRKAIVRDWDIEFFGAPHNLFARQNLVSFSKPYHRSEYNLTHYWELSATLAAHANKFNAGVSSKLLHCTI